MLQEIIDIKKKAEKQAESSGIVLPYMISCVTLIAVLEHYAALHEAAQEAHDGLSALHVLVVLNCKNLNAIETEEISKALEARDKLAARLNETESV